MSIEEKYWRLDRTGLYAEIDDIIVCREHPGQWRLADIRYSGISMFDPKDAAPVFARLEPFDHEAKTFKEIDFRGNEVHVDLTTDYAMSTFLHSFFFGRWRRSSRKR